MKKFTSIILCLILALTCSLATGCAQFKIDKVAYYNAVVAKVGDSSITRHDLLSAYNSYGKSKYKTDDNTEADALKETLEYLEQKEALYLYALDNLDEYKISANQLYNALYDLFDAIDSDLSSIKSEAYTVLNFDLTKEKDGGASVSTSAYTVDNYKYQKRAEVITNADNTVIKFKFYDEKVDGTASTSENHKLHTLLAYLDDPTAPSKDIVLEIKDSYFKYFKDSIRQELYLTANNFSEDMVNKAYEKIRAILADKLIDYEYYLRDADGNAYNRVHEDLFTRYFNRVYTNEIKECYVYNVKAKFMSTVELSTTKLVEKYDSLVKSDYDKYHNDEDEYIEKLQGLSTKGDTLYYHKELTDQKAGYFLHTLIKFSGKLSGSSYTSGEGYKANQLSKLKGTDLESYYNTGMAEIVNDMEIYYRGEDGMYARDNNGELLSVGIADVLAEYSQITTLDEYINFMFKYSQDDASLASSTPYSNTSGTINSNMPYIIGGNNDGELNDDDLSYQKLVDDFVNEGIRILYSTDTMSKKVSTTDGKVSAEDVGDLCISSYGIHFLYYVGEVDDFDIPYTAPEVNEDEDEEVETESNVYISQINSQTDKTNLYTTVLNVATGETYFDKMFDLVYAPEDGSSEVFAKEIIEGQYETYRTELYKNVFENTHLLNEYSDIINGTKTSLD